MMPVLFSALKEMYSSTGQGAELLIQPAKTTNYIMLVKPPFSFPVTHSKHSIRLCYVYSCNLSPTFYSWFCRIIFFAFFLNFSEQSKWVRSFFGERFVWKLMSTRGKTDGRNEIYEILCQHFDLLSHDQGIVIQNYFFPLQI